MTILRVQVFIVFFFFFNDTATTEIYTLSLHDALPIFHVLLGAALDALPFVPLPHGIPEVRRDYRLPGMPCGSGTKGDRKSTRLNSSHGYISYAVFCLKKKKKV